MTDMNYDFQNVECAKLNLQKMKESFKEKYLHTLIELCYIDEMEQAEIISIDLEKNMLTVIFNNVFEQYDVENIKGHPLMFLDIETLKAKY